MTVPEEGRPLAGVLWMVATGLLFVGVTAAVKHAAGRLPAAEAAFLRYALGLVFLLPMLGSLRRNRPRRRDLGVYALRGGVHSAGVILWFFAMTRLPIAEVTAMNYLAPIYVTLGAALLLGERLALRRLLAIGVAFLGALVILRPGFRDVSAGHLAMLGTALAFAASYLMAKTLSGRAEPAMVVAMLSTWVTVGLAPVALSVWIAPTAAEVLWLLAVAAMATGAHYTMTLAFRAAPVTVTQPVTFLQLIWATILGWWAFGERPDAFVLGGGAAILGAVSFIAWREAQLRRRGALSPPPAPAAREG